MKSGYTIRKIVICHRHEPLENTMHLRGQSPRIPLKKFVFENLIFDRGLLLAKKKNLTNVQTENTVHTHI